MTELTLPAYAKLNLTLDILHKRPDGYHEMKMVMQSISLHDDVTVILRKDREITCRVDGAELPLDERNLAVRAANIFFEYIGTTKTGVEIILQKRIPMQAGMAGGSADAAAVLRALQTLLAPSLPMEELETIGARIGSDVPYCVRGGTVLAQGRGEKLTTLCPAPRLWVVVCKPDFSISTPVLFARVRPESFSHRPNTAAMLQAIENGDAAALCSEIGNVFEEVLSEEYREVFAIKEALCAAGAAGAAMTGSGPTVFGLFRKKKDAAQACSMLHARYANTFLSEFV